MATDGGVRGGLGGGLNDGTRSIIGSQDLGQALVALVNRDKKLEVLPLLFLKDPLGRQICCVGWFLWVKVFFNTESHPAGDWCSQFQVSSRLTKFGAGDSLRAQTDKGGYSARSETL
jgi:hypothetical protein